MSLRRSALVLVVPNADEETDGEACIYKLYKLIHDITK